nr:histidine phosphatase family protein [Lysinibacillus timonensis]
MGKLEIYFVRHGETEWNNEGRLQGWLDSPLTIQGRASANMLAENLRNIKFKAVYSSPSGRAIETAKMITKKQMGIQLDPRLQEIHLGEWQGRLISDILLEDQERYFAYTSAPKTYEPCGGETFKEVSERISAFIKECLTVHTEGSLLVVTHAVAIRCMLLSVLHSSIEQIWDIDEISGTSVTKLNVENGEMVVEYIGKRFIDNYL